MNNVDVSLRCVGVLAVTHSILFVQLGMEPFLGRGAPEIDIFEVQPGNIKANTGVFLKSPVGQPFMSASFQVAPGM